MINNMWQQFFLMNGQLSNNIFLLLSGYFLINSQGVKFRKLLNLWLKLFFYAAASYGISLLFGDKAFSFRTILTVLMPVTRGLWWFASAYFVLYLIHPYINIMLKAMSREDCTKFIKALVIYWSIIPMLTKSDFGANDVIKFVCVYCFAAYIRLWRHDLRGKKYIWYSVMFIAVNFLLVMILDVLVIKMHVDINPGYFNDMMRPVTLLASVCLFAGFRDINITYSRMINLAASATFGVYLIHENWFLSSLVWDDMFHYASYRSSIYMIPYSIAVTLIVYISCTLIELLRSKIFGILSFGKLS